MYQNYFRRSLFWGIWCPRSFAKLHAQSVKIGKHQTWSEKSYTCLLENIGCLPLDLFSGWRMYLIKDVIHTWPILNTCSCTNYWCIRILSLVYLKRKLVKLRMRKTKSHGRFHVNKRNYTLAAETYTYLLSCKTISRKLPISC